MLYVKLKSYTVSNIKFQFEVLIEKRLNSISLLLFLNPHHINQSDYIMFASYS